MSRIMSLALAGTTALGLSAASLTGAEAAPFPATKSAVVGGPSANVDQVGWRRGGYYRGGYAYRRRGIGPGGALAAGAAIGIIGGAIAASAAPRYYYDRPAYGYSYPAYGYGYSYPAYGYPAYYPY